MQTQELKHRDWLVNVSSGQSHPALVWLSVKPVSSGSVPWEPEEQDSGKAGPGWPARHPSSPTVCTHRVASTGAVGQVGLSVCGAVAVARVVQAVQEGRERAPSSVLV